METCTWVPLDAANYVAADYGDPIGISDEAEAQLVTELGEVLFLDPMTVMGMFLDDDLIMLQHTATGDLVVASMFADAEIQYLQRVCTSQLNGNGNGKDNKLLMYILGAVGGGGVGYMLMRMRGQCMIGATAGAAVGVVGAFLIAGRNGATAGLGRRIPRRVIPRPRGAMGQIPRQVIPSARGPIGAIPRQVIPRPRGAVGCGGCGPRRYS